MTSLNADEVVSVVVTVKLFSPPTRQVYLSGDRLFRRVSQTLGRSVLKVGAAYRIVDDPSDEEVHGSDIAYLGGRTYPISDSEAAALTAAGYGAFITDSLVTLPPVDGGGDTGGTGGTGGGGTTTPIDPPEYGAGAYGSGLYGS